MKKLQSEDITCNQKYTIKTKIRDISGLFPDVNGNDAKLLILDEYTKCLDARMFLLCELSSSDYKAYNIDDVFSVRTKNFNSNVDYARNFIFCLKIKGRMSSIIKDCSVFYKRYLIFISDHMKYYDLLKSGVTFEQKTTKPEVYQNNSKNSKIKRIAHRLEDECLNWTCGEISLKYEIKERPSVQLFNSSDVYKFILQNVGIDSIQVQEHFFAIYFNHSREVLGFKTIAKGDLKAVTVSIQQILCAGIILNANSFVIIHNHPSNTLIASEADIEITNKIFDAAVATEMMLLDHLILSSYGYLSMLESNIVSFKQHYPYKRIN